LLGGVDSVAVSPVDGSIYVVYGATNTANDQILIKQVTAAGVVTMSGAVSPATAPAALPSVAVTTNGTVGVLYDTFDGTDTDNRPPMTAHLRLSTDLTNWSDTALQTFKSPVTPTAADDSQRVLGDYQQLKAVGLSLYGVFSGNRNGFGGGGGPGSIDPIFFKASPP
jgi:hypothetical protein